MLGPVWRRAFEGLEALGQESAEERTSLGSDGMYVRVMSYETKDAESEHAILEAHRHVVDVQIVLQGSERIDWFPLSTLEPASAYDPEKDVQYYARPGIAPASVDVTPGTFVVLFPEDAHMPQLVTALAHNWVKKAVVKVPLQSLQSTVWTDSPE